MSEMCFNLPAWLSDYQQQYKQSLSLETQMAFVIEASRRNVSQKTGGPFAAGVFEVATGKLVALGVNLVMTERLSILHAEIVAITLAQRIKGHYDLGHKTQAALSLVTTTEPCSMCFGAIPWSGIKQLVTGASDQDARSIGFDEGPKPSAWQQALVERDIDVVTQVMAKQAKQVLQDYQQQGGHIYNSRES